MFTRNNSEGKFGKSEWACEHPVTRMNMKSKEIIKTGLGKFGKDQFDALIKIRAVALQSIREALIKKGYLEVTTASLVNIAGSCENPQASFKLNYYGKEAHLSQSAQLQLEALVIRLKKRFFTVNNSFREEHYNDPEAKGRRLSEFTLIEPERPYGGLTPEEALQKIIKEEEFVIKYSIEKVLKYCKEEIKLLGGDLNFLKKVTKSKFNILTYEEVLEFLNKESEKYVFGDDLGILEERKILKHFRNIPVFVKYFPAEIKFFNMKRTEDGKKVYSVDLLMPKLGETTGGAVREENGELIKKYLRESKVAKYLEDKGQDPVSPFIEYFNLFEQERPLLRGGFGIGFERFIGFLLGSNDILNTITYKTMHPT